MTLHAPQLQVGEMPPKVLKAKASEAYASQSRGQLEEQWILQHLPLVRHIVQKLAETISKSVDVEDLISAGTLGLVKAARAFDQTRQVSFKTYAYIRVRGAVIDELRSRSFVPSAVHGQLRRIEAAHQLLAGHTGRPPSDPELAAEVGISLQQLYRVLQEARRMHFLSIHGLSDDGPLMGALVPPDTSPGPEAQAERHELSRRLAQAIRELPKRDRQVVLLYYDRDLTMKETAEVLGITESRVSQLHASAMFKLSMRLKEAS